MNDPATITVPNPGEGYRLLMADECDGRHAIKADVWETQTTGGAWLPAMKANDPKRFYRVPIE